MRTPGWSRRAVAGMIAVAVVSACGGGAGGQAATSEGAAEAVERGMRATLDGDAEGVMNLMSAECREQVDEAELKLVLTFMKAFLSESDVDLGDLEIQTEVSDFADDRATVEVSIIAPEGTGLDESFLAPDAMEVVYEDGRWVSESCEFADEGAADAEAIDAGLASLGYEGTRDDPVPVAVGAPIGADYTMSVDAIDTDAVAAIEAAGGYQYDLEPGDQRVMVTMTIGYSGTDEPAQLGEVSVSVVGGASATGADSTGCGGIPEELQLYSTQIFKGGVVSGVMCFDLPATDVDGMLIDAQQGYGERSVFFDPTATASEAVPIVGTSGPSPDGDLYDDRIAPAALGTTVEVGDGWTVTVNGFVGDATRIVLDASEYNESPPTGKTYALVDVTLRYDGSENSSSAYSVDFELVGDSNVSVGSSCSVSGLDGELDQFADVYVGGSVSGNLCFVVPDADVESLVAYASAGYPVDRVSTFALR